MKTLIPPKKRLLDMKTGLVSLWFDQPDSIAPDGAYRMMGGIFFPSRITRDGVTRNAGYAMVTGTHVKSKVMYVFEETEWFFVDHILGENGQIKHEGFVTWYTDVWAKYYCSMYAARQDDETIFRYVLDMNRSKMIQPKPDLHDAEWDDPSQPLYLIYAAMQLDRLKARASGILYPELEARQADQEPEKNDYPAVHALMCVSMILDRYYQ